MTTSTTEPATTGGWKAEWQPVIDAIGRDFQPEEIVWGADPVEAGAIRRFLEPLEFDSPIHTDREAARAHGHADLVMPATGVIAWTIPPAWQAGQVLFDSCDRDAQPVHSAINNADLGLGPRTTGFFGTDIEVDFLRPVLVGERIGRRGKTLVACSPKETGVGRGAFLTWQSDVVCDRDGGADRDHEVVARIRIGTYAYVPHPRNDRAELKGSRA